MNIHEVWNIFNKAILYYHQEDTIQQNFISPYEKDSLSEKLFFKAWIDTVQWHCEDEVRHPNIDGEQIRQFKRKIDELNQKRTDLVEQIDDYFIEFFSSAIPSPTARLNTESPAWSIDRLSILALKIYHMERELERDNLSEKQLENYRFKYQLLLTQKEDLISSIQYLIQEIQQGKARFKVYRQVKMYNDADLNPVLRNAK